MYCISHSSCGVDCIGRGNKGEQLMGIRVTVVIDWKSSKIRGDIYDIFMCHKPFGKHCLAFASLARALRIVVIVVIPCTWLLLYLYGFSGGLLSYNYNYNYTYTRKHIVPTQTPAEHSAPSCRKTWPESQQTYAF